MAISNQDKQRLAYKLKQRNRLARQINVTLKPSFPVKILRPEETLDIIYRERDAKAFEKSLDAFLEAPKELTYRGRKSYSTAEMAEMMEIAAQSKAKAEEDIGFYKEYTKEVGVTAGGLTSPVDPAYWSDHIKQFVYKYKDPEEFTRPEQFRNYRERLYHGGLGLEYEQKWNTEYKENFIKAFDDYVVKHLQGEKKQAGKEILEQLKQMGGERYRDAYFTDVLGTIKDVYVESEDEAVDAAQRTVRIFGFEIPFI